MSQTLIPGILRGQLVYLDQVEDEDIPTMAEFYRNHEFMRYLSRGMPHTNRAEDIRKWFFQESSHRYPSPYAIRRHEDDRIVGVCAYKDVVWQAKTALFWIGIGDEALQGKGYGTDALQVMLKNAFLDMNLQRIGLEVGEFNVAAIRSYEKAGFVREGTIRRYMYRDGRFWDMYYMGMLREEWETLYNMDGTLRTND